MFFIKIKFINNSLHFYLMNTSKEFKIKKYPFIYNFFKLLSISKNA